MPCQIETTAPAENRPKAATSDHTYVARPYPRGWSSSRGFCPFFSAMSRNTSLPVSAQECAASAIIDAEPVRQPDPVLAAANSPLAIRAMMTVNVDSPPLDWSAGISTETGASPSVRSRSWEVTPQSYPLGGETVFPDRAASA